MSANCRSLLVLLQRCVAVRQLPLLETIKTRSSVPSVRWSFIQQRTWTSDTRTVCLRRPCQIQAAVRSSQNRFSTKSGSPYEDGYPPLPDYQADSEPQTKEVYIIQVKGLPWSCTTQDLQQFFSECRIRDGEKGIHLTLDRLGRPSGRAFIELEREEDVCKALEKHRQYLGPRYVEVFEVTDSDAESILKKPAEARADDGVVMLRGLPFSCREEDIIHFFSDLDIVENGITIVTDVRGRNSGEAFVQFSSQEEADKALQMDREHIGHRYIEVFPSSRDEIHSSWRRKKPNSNSLQQTRTVPASQIDHKAAALSTHYVHMRGLPFQVSGEDIVKFFSPLVVSKILIECGADGRPSGEADVYFGCRKDAIAAMSRDRLSIGHRYIELFLNSAPDSG